MTFCTLHTLTVENLFRLKSKVSSFFNELTDDCDYSWCKYKQAVKVLMITALEVRSIIFLLTIYVRRKSSV